MAATITTTKAIPEKKPVKFSNLLRELSLSFPGSHWMEVLMGFDGLQSERV